VLACNRQNILLLWTELKFSWDHSAGFVCSESVEHNIRSFTFYHVCYLLSQACKTLLHIESVGTNLFTNSGSYIKWSAPPPHKYMGLHYQLWEIRAYEMTQCPFQISWKLDNLFKSWNEGDKHTNSAQWFCKTICLWHLCYPPIDLHQHIQEEYGSHSISVPPGFFALSSMMYIYSKAKSKRNDKASPLFRPFWIWKHIRKIFTYTDFSTGFRHTF
jgi:hypothetical protein